MAHYDLRQRAKIDAVAKAWVDRCLIADGSLLSADDDQLWSTDNLSRAYANIADAPLLDQRSFLEKLKDQLNGDPQLIHLGAEATIVYYLFAWRGSVSPETKRARVNEILSWADDALDQQGEIWKAFGDEGIGHPGQFFLFRPDIQLGFLFNFARRLKGETEADRRAIVSDPWRLRAFADDSIADGDSTLPGMRHILLHLLQPDYFERISSGEHKQSIIKTYGGLLGPDADEADEDRKLYAIRERLQELLSLDAAQLDFYEPPLAGTWGASAGDGTGLVDALELKRQVVLFGPPGTSKTHEAKELAEQIIRRHALNTWGAAPYFQRQAELADVITTHIKRLQLHPAYSYEEFIRGMRLRNSEVVYEDGYLLQLIHEIEEERNALPAGEAQLPWVLILDELNRVDLSRVLGEAFSVLEDRESGVDLPGVDAKGQARTMKLPDSLYLIGTMNLIDQSVEQIDFALRRRFLWHPSRFDSARLMRVLEERWYDQPQSKRYPWPTVRGDFERFVQRAELLNAQIAASPTLGGDYEVGHTYFFDVVKLLAQAPHMNRARSQVFLWNKKGEALGPVSDLWRMSLHPLLEQYLQGVEPGLREEALKPLAAAFLQGGS